MYCTLVKAEDLYRTQHHLVSIIAVSPYYRLVCAPNKDMLQAALDRISTVKLIMENLNVFQASHYMKMGDIAHNVALMYGARLASFNGITYALGKEYQLTQISIEMSTSEEILPLMASDSFANQIISRIELMETSLNIATSTVNDNCVTAHIAGDRSSKIGINYDKESNGIRLFLYEGEEVIKSEHLESKLLDYFEKKHTELMENSEDLSDILNGINARVQSKVAGTKNCAEFMAQYKATIQLKEFGTSVQVILNRGIASYQLGVFKLKTFTESDISSCPNVSMRSKENVGKLIATFDKTEYVFPVESEAFIAYIHNLAMIYLEKL